MSGIMSMLLGAVSSVAVAVDEFFNRVTLLLPGNGTNGAQNNTFLDSSSNNFTITRNGNTTQGTFSPFSQTGWSNFFTAASSQTIGFANNNAFKFSAPSGNANDFVVEFFVYPTTTSISIPVGTGYTSGTTYWNFGLNRTSGGANSAGQVQFYLTDNFGLQATSGLNANQWNHICAVRTGTTVSLFVNGTRGATATSSVDPNPTGSLYVAGDAVSLGRYLDGYVSNVRIIKGSTLPYDATQSSITVPTAQLSAVTGTTVLTCQSSRFIDNSSNALAITLTSTPSVQAFSPFAPTAAYSAATVGGSGYFDGTGDYLTAAGNAAFAFGTGDFTVAAWIYPTNAQRITILSSNYTYISGSGNWSLYFDVGSAQTLYFNSQSGNKASTVTTTIPLNAWSHIAYTRVGTTGRFFVNGVQLGADISDSFNYGGGTGNLFVGQQNDGNALMLGYMSGIQVLKGTGYSSLPIPTAPATNITNTSLLLNFTNAGITDATAKNDFETAGNAQISTTQSKFGGSSMYFDGTGDWVFVRPPTSDLFAFGTGDFTLECWVYVTTVSPTYQCIWDARTADPSLGAHLVINSGKMTWWLNGASRIQDASSLSINTWYHVAVARSGTSTKMFINGTQVGSTYTDSNSYISRSVPVIGASFDAVPVNPLFGYIDDFRITRGFARYTANFTAPTAAFPVQ